MLFKPWKSRMCPYSHLLAPLDSQAHRSRVTAAPGLMVDYTISTVAETNLPHHPTGKYKPSVATGVPVC
jgi:hypothetical protein